MQTVTLETRGLFQGLDHLAVEKQLLKLQGVSSAVANPASEGMTVVFDEKVTSAADLREEINNCGLHCGGRLVLAAMAENGPRRGDRGLLVYMMCEIPSNVILAEEFAKRFDGFSIGSNDLTQLVLGVDRDSDLLAALFDQRDEAVKHVIAEAIAKAHAAGIKIGICGQAPSNYPNFAAFLVGEGIDSISLNPDSFVRTMRSIAEADSRMNFTSTPAFPDDQTELNPMTVSNGYPSSEHLAQIAA